MFRRRYQPQHAADQTAEEWPLGVLAGTGPLGVVTLAAMEEARHGRDGEVSLLHWRYAQLRDRYDALEERYGELQADLVSADERIREIVAGAKVESVELADRIVRAKAKADAEVARADRADRSLDIAREQINDLTSRLGVSEKRVQVLRGVVSSLRSEAAELRRGKSTPPTFTGDDEKEEPEKDEPDNEVRTPPTIVLPDRFADQSVAYVSGWLAHAIETGADPRIGKMVRLIPEDLAVRDDTAE
jgi:hypothetical protein